MKYPITPDYLAHVPDPLVRLYLELEDYIILKICESLNASGEPNATALELIRQLQRRGMPLKEIKDRIKKTLRISDRELSAALDSAVQRTNAYYGTAFDELGLIQEPAELARMAAEVEAITRQTKAVMRNITQSMGFGMRGMDGSIVISDVQRTYQQILDRAEMRVLSSGCSYNEAIRDGVREMANSGLVGEWVEYRDEAGEVYHRNRVDVAVRRAVMTGVTQISGQRSEMAAEKMETPYREVSAHGGARDVDGPKGWENHKKWQGKVYSVRDGDKYPNIYKACGLGDVTGLEGANCRHIQYPFVEGVSERTYTDEELRNIDPPPFTYQGRKYSAYQATQKQREIERTLRQVKRRMNAFKATGDHEAYTAEAAKYRALNDEYMKFSKAAGLRPQLERSFIQEFGPKDAREAEKALEEAVAAAAKASKAPPAVPITYSTTKPNVFTRGCRNVTQEWIDRATPNSHEVKDLHEFTQDGVTYKTDGINVKHEYDDHEKAIAELLESKFGGELWMMPTVKGKYLHVRTPDYLFRGRRFDLKTMMNGTSKQAVYKVVTDKPEQADNFILDVTNSPLGDEEILRQAREVFESYNARGVNTIIIFHGEDVLQILERNN